MNNIKDYDNITLQYPHSTLITDKTFKEFDNFDFSEVQVKHIDIRKNFVEATAYAEVKNTSSDLSNLMFGGRKKITLIAKKGYLGWKVVAFAIIN